ncbi:MAG: phosphate ABC transporter permease PstA [Planctomycetota bacterium]|nr:phosphate ABC transporter permease PstA [Planctomycetota bacterium]
MSEQSQPVPHQSDEQSTVNGLQRTNASRSKQRIGVAFEFACRMSTWFSVAVLVVLLAGLIWKSWGWLDADFLTNFDSRHPGEAGIWAGIWGSVWLMFFTMLFSVPIGIGAAIYLEEYAPPTRLTRFIQINLSNLAGVPSIVYGILGLTTFVRMFGAFGANQKVLAISLGFGNLRIPLPLDRTVLSAALTLSLLIMPVVIVAAQEALRAVPGSIRHGSFALGATKWQTIRHQVLPASLPGILTGVILAVSRAIGETAPLLMVGAFMFVTSTPGGIQNPVDLLTNPQGVLDAPFEPFTAIPIQILNWVQHHKHEFEHVAAAGIIVLLVVLLVMNASAVLLRNRYQSKVRW